MKSPFLDKIINRLDRVDSESLQGVVLKLAREKGFLETLFNTLQEGILVIDADGRISYSNAAAGRLLGLDPETCRGEPIAKHLRDLDWDRIWSADRGEWRKVVSHEIEVFYPQHRFLSFYIVPLVDEESDLVSGMALILRDVTERRQQTATTIESEKLTALTLLAAGVAHELGNPLNSLNIHLQLIERELADLPPATAQRVRDDLLVARDEIDRLDGIIQQFLRAIRPTKPDLQRSNINEILTTSLGLLEREITDRDILVEREFATDVPRLMLDPGQLKQAFYNLIKNALQAMQPGGILRLRTTATDSSVVVEFIDSGRGISAAEIGRIFEPYYTTKEQGSGLGLMIVQRIVREHGGTMEIESDEGHGTTVRVRLPLEIRRSRLLQAGKKS